LYAAYPAATAASWVLSTSACESTRNAVVMPGPPVGGSQPGLEAADDVDRVPGEPDTTGEDDLDVRLGVGAGRDVEPEGAVERKTGGHVGDDEADEIESRCHVTDPRTGPDRPA